MKIVKSVIGWLMAAAMVLSAGCLSAFAAEGDESAVDYKANLRVKTAVDTGLWLTPDGGTEQQSTLESGVTLTARGLHKNTAGEFWYEIIDGTNTRYIPAGDAVMVEQLADDVAAVDLMTPAALGLGEAFSISGSIVAKYNELQSVTASVYQDGSAVMSANADTLENLNSTLAFDELDAGAYTFVLTARICSYYIDAGGALATAVKTVTVQKKNLVVTDSDSPNAVLATGVDVADWNGEIDWKAAAGEIDFAVLRIGSRNKADNMFAANAAGCVENDIPYGVYYVSAATTEEAAVAEAEYVLQLLGDYVPELGIFFDVEYSLHDKLTSLQLQAVTKAFCESIRSAGFEPGLYSYTELFEEHFSDAYFSSMPKWVSEIDMESCSYSGGVTMWQYSWSGRVSGISSEVDCNYYYGNLPGRSDTCEHSHRDYAFVDGYHTLTCSACGDVQSVAGTNELRFKAINLALGSDISINYKAPVDSCFKDVYVVFDVGGEETYVHDYAVESSTGRYVFTYEGINPQLMGENVNATIYATLNGYQVSFNYPEYSVLTYCSNQLSKATTTAETRTMISNLLVYGAKVQILKDFETDSLLPDRIDPSYSQTPTSFPGTDALVDGQVVSNNELKNDTHDMASASLVLSNKVSVKFGYKLDDATGYTYKVTINGSEYIYTADDLTYDETKDRYYLEFSEFYANEFDAAITAVVLQDGVQVSRGLTYTVNTYIKKNANNGDALADVLKALYCYGEAAKVC